MNEIMCMFIVYTSCYVLHLFCHRAKPIRKLHERVLFERPCNTFILTYYHVCWYHQWVHSSALWQNTLPYAMIPLIDFKGANDSCLNKPLQQHRHVPFGYMEIRRFDWSRQPPKFKAILKIRQILIIYYI